MKSILVLAALSLFTLSTASRAGEQFKSYPLQTCFISGEKLGEMGQPVVLVYAGQEYKFCCKSCQKKFVADPAKYTKDFEAAQKSGS